MTTQKVNNDVLAAGGTYVAGLLALLLWPNRQSADQLVVLIVAMVIVILMGMTVDWLAFHWRPDVLAFLTQTGPGWTSRPRRYSLPKFLGLMTALTLGQWLRITGVADWGLTAYVISVPPLLVGFWASNLWWALASKSGSGETPGH